MRLMGVPNSEVGYTPAMPRREDHEVHNGHVVALDKKKKVSSTKLQFIPINRNQATKLCTF